MSRKSSRRSPQGGGDDAARQRGGQRRPEAAPPARLMAPRRRCLPAEADELMPQLIRFSSRTESTPPIGRHLEWALPSLSTARPQESGSASVNRYALLPVTLPAQLVVVRPADRLRHPHVNGFGPRSPPTEPTSLNYTRRVRLAKSPVRQHRRPWPPARHRIKQEMPGSRWTSSLSPKHLSHRAVTLASVCVSSRL